MLLRSLILNILVAVSMMSVAQDVIEPEGDPAWSRPTEPFRIAGNLYYVGTYDLACYLITTPSGNILINTGLAGSVLPIEKSIGKLGFKLSDTKILLNTQAHYDHTGGLAEIKNRTGARMMIHEADAQVLGDGGKSDFLFGGNVSSFAPVKADGLLKDGDIIELGGSKLKVLHHPGHTKGSTSFMFDTKDDQRSWKVLIANIPSILSETKLDGMPSYPNVGKDYARTLSAMKTLKFDIWVASHAGQFGLHEKRKEGDSYRPEAFSDRGSYDESLRQISAEYERRLKAGQN